MARSQEKSGNMLNRWLAAKGEELAAERGRPGGRAGFERRPRASECRDLAEADKWRAKLLREIGSKVLEVQNPGLGEERLRELNDEINKLLRVKWHWEKRIVELGGQNYLKEAPPVGGGGGGGSSRTRRWRGPRASTGTTGTSGQPSCFRASRNSSRRRPLNGRARTAGTSIGASMRTTSASGTKTMESFSGWRPRQRTGPGTNSLSSGSSNRWLEAEGRAPHPRARGAMRAGSS